MRLVDVPVPHRSRRRDLEHPGHDRVELTAGCGNGRLEHIDVTHVSGEAESLDAAAVFIFIGVAPRTGAFDKFIQTDDKGFIKVACAVTRARRA